MSEWVGGTVEMDGFNSLMDGVIEQIEDPRLKVDAARSYALRFIEHVVPKTPVDTGRARAAWTAARTRVKGVERVRIGGNDHGEEKRGIKEGRYTEKGLRTPGPELAAEIFNGAPHIVPLELGSSLQAPSGFVRLAVRKMLGQVVEGESDRVEAALRVANIKARRSANLRQGGPRRNTLGRANLGRR